jgi:hypothetical protein
LASTGKYLIFTKARPPTTAKKRPIRINNFIEDIKFS